MDDIERIARIERRAWRRTGELAGELARADSHDREGILAELGFERWVAECCGLCRGGP